MYVESRPSFIKGLLANRSGAAALEFAMVGPIFIAIILSIIELGLNMTKIAMLDYAVSNASKFIYTGAVQDGTPTQSEIADFICNKAVVFTNCRNNIAVELTPITAFSAPPTNDAPCLDSDADPALAPTVAYSTGNGSQIMFIRVCITTDILTPGLGAGLYMKKASTNRTQIVSSIAFMNEPF